MQEPTIDFWFFLTLPSSNLQQIATLTSDSWPSYCLVFTHLIKHEFYARWLVKNYFKRYKGCLVKKASPAVTIFALLRKCE